jgi:hypothetical protein
MLALKGHGAREVEMDYPEMMTHLKASESTAKRAIAELVRRKHIGVSRRHNSANVYQFTSSVFAEGAALLPVGETGSHKPAVASLVNCAKCHKACKRVMRTGWCRSCNRDVDLKAAVDRIRITAPNITDTDLARRLMDDHNLSRMTARLRRVMRKVAA